MLFQDARLKIERANKHIADIEARIGLLKESEVSTIEIDPNTRCESLKYDFADTKAFSDIALILGDVIHNLKCALDYTWLRTIEIVVPVAVGKFAKFPVYETLDELKTALKGRKIDILASTLFDFMVNEVQPCMGGNPAIWPIHKLDIRDKHRLLIPILSSGTVVNVKVQDEAGEIWSGRGSSQAFQRPPYVITFEAGYRVNDKGKFSADIIVEDVDIPDSVLLVPSTLKRYSGLVSRIVECFEIFAG